MPTVLVAGHALRCGPAEWRTIAACDAAGIIAACEAANPDLLVLTPELQDGITSAVCSQWKSNPRLSSVPLLVVGSDPGDGLADAVLTADSGAAVITSVAGALIRAARAEDARRESEDRLEALLSLAGDGYIEIGPDWRIRILKGVAEKSAVATGRGVRGEVIWDAFPSLPGTVYEERYRSVMYSRRPERFEAPSLVSDRWYDIRVLPIGHGIAVHARDITSRKAVEEQYRASFELASIAKVQAEIPSGRFVRVNRKMCELLGYSEAELLSLTASQVTHPADRPADAECWSGVCSGRLNEYSIEKRYLRKSGGHVWARVHVGVIRDAKGTPVSTSGVVEDITEWKKAEEGLHRAQRRLRHLADSNIIGIVVSNMERIVDANDAFLEIIGRTREDMRRGIDWKAITPPESLLADEHGLKQLVQTGVCMPFEKEYLLPDGTRRPVLIGAARLTDEPEWICFVLDLTDRKRADGMREETRRRLESLLDLGQVIVHDESSTVSFWSAGAERMYGWTKAEAVGRHVDELLKTRFPEPKQAILDRIHRDGTWDGLLCHVNRNGRELTVASHWSLWQDDSGNTAILEINNDVTQQVRAEERLRAAQIGAGLGVWDWQIDKHEVFWSPEYYALYGLEPETTRPSFEAWIESILEPDRHRVQESVLHAQASGERLDIEFRISRRGETRWLRAVGDVSETREGRTVRMTGVAQDITEIKRFQMELERANVALQRSNEELRQFAYGVSHDLQEPLRNISAFSQLLARKNQGKLESDSAEYLRHVLQAADRMQFMLQDLLRYSSVVHQAEAADPVRLGAVVEWTLGNLKQQIEETRARITVGQLPTVRGDFARLSQVFQNLIGNALKYRGARMPEVEISALQNGAEWTICVADNGTGFDPVHKEVIFGVFRRLHGREIPGSGVGLAIVRRIVEHHGGRIWAESTPGQGSKFYFTLPATGEEPAEPRA